MKRGLQLVVICVYGLLGKLEKNGIQHVLLNNINRKKDGCFGAVFMVKHKGLVYFGKRIGVPSIDILIVLTRYQ